MQNLLKLLRRFITNSVAWVASSHSPASIASTVSTAAMNPLSWNTGILGSHIPAYQQTITGVSSMSPAISCLFPGTSLPAQNITGFPASASLTSGYPGIPTIPTVQLSPSTSSVAGVAPVAPPILGGPDIAYEIPWGMR